jgi:hypothetical protein
MDRAVLQADVSRDDIDDAALRSGWQLTNVLPGGAERPAQMIYAAQQGRTVLYLVEDGRLDVLYFAAAGEGSKALMDEVRGELRCCEPDDYRPLVADLADVMRLRRGLGLLVLTQPEPDAEALRVFEQALVHDDLQARSVALTAVTYAPWPALKPLIGRVVADDPLPALRATAAQLLAALFP